MYPSAVPYRRARFLVFVSHCTFEDFPYNQLKLLHYEPHGYCESFNKFLSSIVVVDHVDNLATLL